MCPRGSMESSSGKHPWRQVPRRILMATRNNSVLLRIAVSVGLMLSLAGVASLGIGARAQVPASAATSSQLGTVKTVSGNTVTVSTDAGQTIAVTVPSDAKVVQLPVGSTDLKSAMPSQFTDIAVGDRVLVTGKAGDTAATFNAVRVVLIKSSAIAQMQAAQQNDWRTRGVGGIVSSVDAASGAVTLTVGAKKLVVNTTSKTVFKRFSGDSVKYEDAKPGTLAQIQKNDQLQARGNKSADGTSISAEEVVSGAFLNLSGLLTSIDTAAGKITFKDLASKKVMTVNVTAKSDIRTLPLMMATRFAGQTSGSGGGGGGGRGGRGGGGAGQGNAAGGGQRSTGADLAQMMERLPTGTLADLKTGDAVMIVASEPSDGSSTVDAITLLSGVEPILTANPNGGMDLSMSVGGGGGGGE